MASTESGDRIKAELESWDLLLTDSTDGKSRTLIHTYLTPLRNLFTELTKKGQLPNPNFPIFPRANQFVTDLAPGDGIPTAKRIRQQLPISLPDHSIVVAEMEIAFPDIPSSSHRFLNRFIPKSYSSQTTSTDGKPYIYTLAVVPPAVYLDQSWDYLRHYDEYFYSKEYFEKAWTIKYGKRETSQELPTEIIFHSSGNVIEEMKHHIPFQPTRQTIYISFPRKEASIVWDMWSPKTEQPSKFRPNFDPERFKEVKFKMEYGELIPVDGQGSVKPLDLKEVVSSIGEDLTATLDKAA